MTDSFIASMRSASPGKGRAKVVKQYHELSGFSKQKLYRIAKEAGLGSANIKRCDKGATVLSEEEIKQASSIINATKRRNGKIVADGKTVCEILKDSGLMQKGVSVSTVLRQLRKRNLSAKHLKRPTPHRNLVAEFPNQWHLFDVSVCLMYFLDKKKGLTDRFKDDESVVLYPNKLHNYKKIKKHILRYAIVDKASGSLFWQYFENSGETAIDTAKFFHEAWLEKEDSKYRFHGVPFNIYTDKGSMANNAMIHGLAKSLKVNIQTHMPGNPRAKGAIETMHRWIETKFESRLSFQRPKSLEQLNAWAMDYATKWNSVKGFRKTEYSRAELFSMIKPEQLRIVPEWPIYQTLLRARAETRKVGGDLIISYYSKFYKFDDPNLAGQKVEVTYNPYHFPTIEATTDDGETFVADPIPEADVFGQPTDNMAVMGSYHAYKDTETTKIKKAGNKWLAEIQGTKVSGQGDKARVLPADAGDEKGGLKLFGHQAEKVENLAYMRKKGIPIEVEEKAGQVLPMVRGLLVIADELGRNLTADENKMITEKYTVGIPVGDIDLIVKKLSAESPEAEGVTG